MAISTCPSCHKSFFELKELNISGANYRQYAVQCSACGAVVGVLPYLEPTVLIEKVKSAVDTVSNNIHTVNNNIGMLEEKVNVLTRKVNTLSK